MGVASKVCPKCCTKNNPEFWECWKCKMPLKDAKVIQFEGLEALDEMASVSTTGNGTITCPSCKMLTAADLGKCRACGSGLGNVGALKFEWSDFLRKLFTTIILVLAISCFFSLLKDFNKENITVRQYIKKVHQEMRTDGIYKALTGGISLKLLQCSDWMK